MKKTTAITSVLFLILVQSNILAAPPTLKIPSEVKPTGQYAEMLPEGDSVTVTYVGLSGVDSIPSRVLNDKRLFLLDTRGLPTGAYKFVAIGSSKEGEQTRVDFVVIVGDSPTPVPPVPPGPNPPVPPGPATELEKKLQEAYNKETDPKKAELKTKLTEVYLIASKLSEDTKLVKWVQLFSAIKAGMSAAGLSDDKLQGCRKVVQEYLLDRFPTDQNKALTTDDRKLITDTFKTLATSMERVK